MNIYDDLRALADESDHGHMNSHDMAGRVRSLIARHEARSDESFEAWLHAFGAATPEQENDLRECWTAALESRPTSAPSESPEPGSFKWALDDPPSDFRKAVAALFLTLDDDHNDWSHDKLVEELRDVLARFPEQKPAEFVDQRAADLLIESHGAKKPADVGADEPVAWIRTLDGKLDWAEDCLSNDFQGAMGGYEPEDGYSAIPLYASPPPATVANIPEGWQLVPKGTNWDMRNEAREYMISVGLNSGPLNLDKVAHAIWETMLAAAPNPNTEGSREHE